MICNNNLKRNLILLAIIFSIVFLIILIWIMNWNPFKSNSKMSFGRQAHPNEFPYVVSIGPGWCAGTIFHENFVITAKSCIKQNGTTIYVVAGEINEDHFNTEGEWRRVTMSKFFIDENFAILFIPEPFTFNEKIQPVHLPTLDHPTPNKLIVTGWGTANYNCSKYGERVLQTAIIDVKDDEINKGHIDTRSSLRLQNGICSGDDGSGLVEKTKMGKFILIGILANGFRTLCTEYSDEYEYAIKVTYYLKRIKHVMNKMLNHTNKKT